MTTLQLHRLFYLIGPVVAGFCLFILRDEIIKSASLIFKPFYRYLVNSYTRQARGLPKGAKMQNRMTDLVEELSKEDAYKHRIAEQYCLEGRIQKSAEVFESIGFQRRAVTILEENGFIHEAVSVLQRLGAGNGLGLYI